MAFQVNIKDNRIMLNDLLIQNFCHYFEQVFSCCKMVCKFNSHDPIKTMLPLPDIYSYAIWCRFGLWKLQTKEQVGKGSASYFQLFKKLEGPLNK